jgi:tRNA uridine 5-carboxymethylaminomethyl modification enzyme
LGVEHGLIGAERLNWFRIRQAARTALDEALAMPATASAMALAGATVRQDGSRRSLFEWARFAEVTLDTLCAMAPELGDADVDLRDEVLEDARYAPYLERQDAEIRELKASEAVRIPADMDYDRIAGLSLEMRDRLNLSRPETLAAASRIRGITPAAVAAILIHVRRQAA